MQHNSWTHHEETVLRECIAMYPRIKKYECYIEFLERTNHTHTLSSVAHHERRLIDRDRKIKRY